MAESKYYISSMGNLHYRSGKLVHLSFSDKKSRIRNDSKANTGRQGNSPPILRLRPRDDGKGNSLPYAPQGAIAERHLDKTDHLSDASEESDTETDVDGYGGAIETIRPPVRRLADGPWLRHPDQIDDKNSMATDDIPDGITIQESRDRHKESMAEIMRMPIAERRKDFKCILWVITKPKAVDMMAAEGQDEELVELEVERWFVNSPIYLQPGANMPPSMTEHYGCDWRWNARGVYYRHYYSPEWVTGDHSLWIPTLDALNWDDSTEKTRRARAHTFLKHALSNEGWNKSEYAWEADAWSDVFGQMRDDPVVACDKHEFYTMRSAVHSVSCLQTGQSQFKMRIPDATFGLATFLPRDYQNANASYDLDADRLQALALHRNCSLLGDPRWGEANLVFPFGVYEAKGWKGDPREARYQACSAAAVYLDLLDALARHPGFSGKIEGAYQTPESRSSQVFALTSFGAHWHVMVGYRRPRLAREHRGRSGMSDTVYLFQRIWSGRINTERKAWELLSFVDQIHEWGVTTHRDFVIRHLKPWHEFCRRCYFHDASVMHFKMGDGKYYDGHHVLRVDLPAWTQHFSTEVRSKLTQVSGMFLLEAYRKYFRTEPQKREGDQFRSMFACVLEGCGPYPGYPISSPEEALMHYTEHHGRAHVNDPKSRRAIYEMFIDEPAEGGIPLGEEYCEEDRGAKATVSVDMSVGSGRKRRCPELLEDGDLGMNSRKRARE